MRAAPWPTAGWWPGSAATRPRAPFFQAGNDVSGWVTDDGWALHLRGAATSEPEARAAVERLHAIATGQAVAARTLTNDDAVAIANAIADAQRSCPEGQRGFALNVAVHEVRSALSSPN